MKNREKKKYYKLFLKFLKDNDAYDRFIRGLRNDPGFSLTDDGIDLNQSNKVLLLKYFLKLSENLDKIKQLIGNGFDWSNSWEQQSEELEDYWSYLDDDWKDLINTK